MVNRSRQHHVPLVTEAKRPMSEDIAYRERRYLLMMGIRVACFIITIVLVVSHAGWFAVIPGAGAIVIPYFAVVFANGGREPSNTRGFREYQPNLPDRYSGPSAVPGAWSRSATIDGSIGPVDGHEPASQSDTAEDYRTQ